MNPTKFEEANIIIAENQPEYTPIPALMDVLEGTVTFCWKLSWKERFQVLVSGKIWHTVLTFNTSLQPQKLSTRKLK